MTFTRHSTVALSPSLLDCNGPHQQQTYLRQPVREKEHKSLVSCAPSKVWGTKLEACKRHHWDNTHAAG